MRGSVLDGRYRLLAEIGAGGMGQVWRAEDSRLGRRVAVKLLSVPPGTPAAARERLLAMFVREARAAASLDSSYIVPVFDHGVHEGTPYLVMPHLLGRTVRELIAEEGALPLGRIAEVCAQVCRALAAAHGAGIVHRDVKPANVMVTAEGTVKMLDFGLAKFLDATSVTGYLTASADAPIGTLHYMAPERFTGKGDDGRTDVYALGCMAYEMATGSPPFDSGSAAALMHCHVYEAPGPPSLRRAGLPADWDRLLLRMLAKEPDGRPDARQAETAFTALAAAAPAAAQASAPAVSDSAAKVPTSGDPAGTGTAPPAPAPAPGPDSYPLLPPRPAYAPPPGQFGPPSALLPPQPPVPGPGGGTHRRRWWAVAAAAVALAAVAGTLTVLDPFGGGGDDGTKTDGKGSPSPGPVVAASAVAPLARTQTLATGTEADSRGPAPAVRGARAGGTVTVLEPGLLEHTDPGKIWSEGERLLSHLLHRSLTGLKTGRDGGVKVVGDLAEGPGTASDGGRTWTFRLKPGLRYSDGSAVRAADFAYAVERAMSTESDFTLGDLTLRTFLLGEGKETGELPADAVETPDERTVVYHLAKAHPDFDVVLTGPGGVPVPEKGDDPEIKPEDQPSTGPYRVSSFTGGKGLQLVRNREWDPDTDPLRTAYPDRFGVEANVDAAAVLKRTGSAGDGEPVMTFTGALKASDAGGEGTEVVSAPAPLVQSYTLNTERLKDQKVREAVVTALPAAALLKASGERGEVRRSILPPGVRGARKLDVHGAGADGDPARARALLAQASQDDRRITLGASEVDKERTAVVEQALEKAGFEVTVETDEVGTFYQKAKDGDYDLFRLPLGGGFPVASTFLPSYFDSRLGESQSINYSRLSSGTVDEAIDEATATGDLAAAGKLWSALDRRVTELAAVAPVYVQRRDYPHSAALKGLQAGLEGVSPLNAWVER
ncbi:ABC transporter substrate-binding protein [Streptomyces sp. SCSIO ZS0520]|uniref:ABC transporter substrate-binding protein n=1 Tax=Streptomyces sp. SCSIO ZS0520 TaxID=2892996 RepID=UPI0021D9DAEB|nr:ABC transporter substrate-binding protein [Streptomyces sp. SCSIO ZS0520]